MSCDRGERVRARCLGVLPPDEAAQVEAHLTSCADCRREAESLRPVVEALAGWPSDGVRPRASLWERLSRRVAPHPGRAPAPSPDERWREPPWEEVAPGISCKLLAADEEREVVSMLVRLAPGCEYPPHTHAGTEELHLLDGELWIDGRKLLPGDYNRAEAGTSDARVWSETGCTCVLITSTRDALG
jgi:anti-sigma factor ChrR (cupin superfamily)